ncbi:MAG TPA: hypothetical protein VK949_01435 [Methylotenera sp.]|nr:hypothetical protein [Methylotenera sp.]
MKKPFYIDFPQEHVEGQMHRYRCVFCQQETTTINGRLEGHLPTCTYRLNMEKAGYEAVGCCEKPSSNDADDFD